MIPSVSSGRLFDEIPYQGGAFRLDWALPWLNETSGRVARGDLNGLVHWEQFPAHSTLDSYWKRIHFTDRDVATITIPTLTFTGWFDGDQSGARSYWDGMSRRPGGAGDNFLVIGFWTHAGSYQGGGLKVGAFNFDSAAIIKTQELRIKFFDWCVRRPHHLRSGGRATSLDGDGVSAGRRARASVRRTRHLSTDERCCSVRSPRGSSAPGIGTVPNGLYRSSRGGPLRSESSSSTWVIRFCGDIGSGSKSRAVPFPISTPIPIRAARSRPTRRRKW